MDSDRPVGYFRIEMSDCFRQLLPIFKVRLDADPTQFRFVRDGLFWTGIQ
jgi:hypothetical protein